jgi:hypothetical protein
MWRGMAAGASVVIATFSGVLTGLVTQHASPGLWVALGVVAVLGGGLQVAISGSDRQTRGRVAALGSGSVAVGGSSGEIRTRVSGRKSSSEKGAAGEGVVASGDGSVGVGGDAPGPISTEVTGIPGPERGCQG